MLMPRVYLCALFSALTLASFAADIIIESRSEGKNHSGYSEPAGTWTDSNTPVTTAKSGASGLTAQGTAGSRKTVVDAGSGNTSGPVSSARFTPAIESPGDYHVYLTFPRAGNAAPVEVYVKHAKGEDAKNINQDGWGALDTANGDTWIELGKYPFTSDGEQYVELRITGDTIGPDARNPAQAFADAVRFVSEPLPAAAPAAPSAPAKAPVPEATPITMAIGSAGSQSAPGTASPVAAAPAAAVPVAAPLAPPSSAPLQWAADLAAGRAAAGKDGRKVFVFFYSPKSRRSVDYEKQVLDDPQVKGVIAANYVPVKVNMDTEKELTAQLQVFRAGAIRVYDAATGNGLERIDDAPEATELARRLSAVK